jgi:hypothetical protein
MSFVTSFRQFLFVLALALAPACIPLRPPVQNSGPTVSREGVQVAVSRQRCSETVETEQPGNNLTEETIDVQVRNVLPTSLTVHRDAFYLVTPDGASLKTLTYCAADPLTLSAGETRSFELRYMTRGSLQCERPMKLDVSLGISAGGNPVDLAPIQFVPARAI